MEPRADSRREHTTSPGSLNSLQEDIAAIQVSAGLLIAKTPVVGVPCFIRAGTNSIAAQRSIITRAARLDRWLFLAPAKFLGVLSRAPIGPGGCAAPWRFVTVQGMKK